MFEINRIDHIGLIVDEFEPVVKLFELLLGFRVGSPLVRSGYIGVDMEIPGTKGISIEILKSDKSAISKKSSLINKKAAIHHVGLHIKNLPLAINFVNELYMEALEDERSDQFVPFEAKLRSDSEGQFFHIAPGWKYDSDFYYEIFDGESLHLPNYFLDNVARGIGIKKLNAWAHVSNDDVSLSDWYERLFGLETVYYWNPSPVDYGFSVRTLKFLENEMNVEILKPLKEDSYMQKFLDEFGCSVHHISFEVENIDSVSQICDQFRIEVLGLHSGVGEKGKWHECFIAPPQIRGLLIHFFSWEIQ